MKKLAYGIVLAFAAMSAAVAFATGDRIPAGYTEIEYIQGNGLNTRIVTDYTPQPNIDKIEAVVEWPANTLNAHQAVWCSRGNDTQVDSWTLFYIKDNNKFRYDYMPSGHAVSLVPNFANTTDTKYTITAEDNTVTYSSNGTVLDSQDTPAYSYTAGSVLALFTSHYNGTKSNVGNYGKHKLYSFKVWRSGVLIHYFVPCKDANGVATLVDICDNPATLTKDGTFSAGSDGHYYDDSLFPSDDALEVSGFPGLYGSPTPAYGIHTGLSAGDTVAVSCAPYTNTTLMIEYICTGWKLFNGAGTEVSNGTETAFTYTHPTPAAARRLVWQWAPRALSTISDATLPVDGAAFHVDASMPSTIDTIESDGKQLVTAWRDASGGSMRAVCGTASRPRLVTDDKLPYIDFGPQTSGNASSVNDNAGALVWSSELTTVREVFLVFSDYPGSQHSFFFGASGTYHFHRNQKKLFNNQYASANVKNGLKEVDGVECTIDYELPEGFHIIHLRTTGNVTAGRFAWDRNVNYGGQRLQEVVVYTKTLTDAEAGEVYDYLHGKWIAVPGMLEIDAFPAQLGSPTPAYGAVVGLASGEALAVSCGAPIATNDEDRVYACAGWTLYDLSGSAVLNGTETSFTYTHPTPVAYRKLEWQWVEPLTILPIPDQIYNFGDICRPELTVSNVINAATWTIGGDIVSADFDVEYVNNVGAGVASVTVTGTGAYPGATASATFNISATALEDANLSTTDNAARRLEMDGKYVYIFTNAASAASVTLKRNLVLTDVLLVGGGGAGGNTMAGGGGAGGFIELADVYAGYEAGETIAFTVGAGGAVATGQNRGGNGGDTILTLDGTTHTAKGGGGGGGWSSTVGASGGSGGGSTRGSSVGLGVEGQGHAGARAASGATSSTGGGGGAGESGHGPTTSPARSGDGGAGRLFAVTGEYYGGGGGGGGSVLDYGTALAGSGGLGGGGDGGRDTGGADGADGYGGGGGGGGWTGANQFGGKGGSGTVILVFRQTDLGVNPIPDQRLDNGGASRPAFTVVNTRTAQSWTLGGDSVSPDFDVVYTNNTAIGVAGVTVVGKGEYAGERFYTTFHIISDGNIATDDLTVRTLTANGRKVYVFKNAALGRMPVTVQRGLFLADALLVGGGGAGGNTMGAGGGGGGVLELNGVNAIYAPNDTIYLTVGAGGVISATPGQRGTSGGRTLIEFGADSGASAASVAGGGAGGAWGTNTGLNGASGGGGCKTAAGGAGTEGLGYAGAAGSGDGKSGGGGGAGHAGYATDTTALRTGDGGEGVTSDITGEAVYYGGGGGAGGSDNGYGLYAPGTGGLGGGGTGGKELHGANGVDGLGGGGGGGGYNGVIAANGGNGGSGTVILAFTAADLAIDPVPSQVLAAGGACPEPVVRLYGSSAVLTKDVDYTVSYTDNDALGTALMTVTGIGTYAGKVGYAKFLVVERYYAKPAVDVEGDGLSWATAMSVTNFFATHGVVDSACEVWIAAGTVSAQAISITNNAQLVIRGGFAGTETSLDERSEGALTVFDGERTATTLLKIEGSTDSELVIDHLKFCNARANGFIKSGGGSLQILGCAIEANGRDVGTVYGRGMNVQSDGLGTLVVKDSVFGGNINSTQDNTYGGFGIYISNFSGAIVEDSLFVTNGCPIASPYAGGWVGYNATGAAICAKDTPTTVRRSRFAGNSCPIRLGTGDSRWGGGTITLSGNCGGSVIDHCTFIGNTDRLSYQGNDSVDCGGALVVRLNNAADKVKVDHCTFAYNLTHGGSSAGGVTVVKGDVDIANTIFWQNTRSLVTKVGYGSDVQVHSSGSANIRHSTVTTLDGTALVGAGLTIDEDSVFAADPKLVTTTDDFEALLTKTSSYTYYTVNAAVYGVLVAMDAHLKSPAGYFVNGGAAGPATTDYSPAIDAGDPAADYSNEPAPNGGRLNLGAFGNTAEASSSATGQPEANVEVTFPDGMTRPKVTITMGLESGDAYSAVVQLYCTTGGVLLSSQNWSGVGDGDVLELFLPYYLTNGDDFRVLVMINATNASPVEYQASETVDGNYPPFYGKGGGPNVIHVRTGADCKMDGTSWTDAYPDLGTALNAAPGEGITEIWLAVTNDYMTKAITLAYPLTIRGGFAGVENSEAERPEGTMTWLDGNNVYRTMEFAVPQGALLTVERIRFSHSSQPELKKSGKGDLRVLDCLFTNPNGSGTIAGRGIYATGAGTVAVTNCNFLNMIGPAEDNSGGGALYFDSCAAAYVDHCLFVTNGTSFKANGGWARYRGAAAFVNATPTVFSNCRFAACGAALREATVGGVVEFVGASGGSKLVNCVFVGNNDFQSMNMPDETVCAGAIAVTMSATSQTLDVENCTVAYNITQGKWNAAGITVGTGTVNLKNSIVYGNVRGWKAYADAAGADIAVRSKGILNMSYSLVTGTETNYISMIEGGITNIGPGMIYGDPRMVSTNDFRTLFTDGGTYWYLNGNAVRAKCAALDAHLRSITGYLVDGRLFKYEENSPAIDAGDSKSDFHGEPDCIIGWHGKRVNMGAYGNTPEAAMTALPGFLFILR